MRGKLLVLLGLLVSGCAGLPAAPGAPSTSDGPAAVVDGIGIATAQALHWRVETLDGRFLGSATALAPRLAVTNRHVLAAAPEGATLVLRQGAVTRQIRATEPAPDADAALLRLAEPAEAPLRLRAAALSVGEPLVVAGAADGQPRIGHGTAEAPGAANRFGAGLLAARLPATPGYSGGPVLDAQGRLVGIVMAAVLGSREETRRLGAAAFGTSPGGHFILLVPATRIEALCGLPACGAGASTLIAAGARRGGSPL